VRKGYHELVQKEPERWKVIDASKPMTTVQTELRTVARKTGDKYDLDGLLDRSPTKPRPRKKILCHRQIICIVPPSCDVPLPFPISLKQFDD